jgi:tyrosine-protein phosphatase SIW14
MLITQVDNNLYRGARPTSRDDFADLKEIGVETILNLEGGFWGWIDGNQTEDLALANQFGITQLHLPMGALWPPVDEDIYLALDIIAKRKAPLYVHCLEGRDRTGIVIAAYRMQYNGYTYEAAKSEMYGHNFHKYYFYWLPVLKLFQKN